MDRHQVSVPLRGSGLKVNRFGRNAPASVGFRPLAGKWFESLESFCHPRWELVEFPSPCGEVV